jgi:hypothetical protein
MRRMADSLRRRFPTLQSSARVYEGESHVTVMSGALSNALKYLYSDYGTPKLLMTPALAASYAGQWRTATGQAIVLRANGARLDLSMQLAGNTVASPLEALTRDTLFASALATRITAERNEAGRIVRLRWTLLGPAVFERVK